MDVQKTKAFVAVHTGAGFYSSQNNHLFRKRCRIVCDEVLKILESGSSAMDAVCTAVAMLEDDPLTNAGIGSNLTRDGTVECDASVMESENSLFGACGAVKGVKNPVLLARQILVHQVATVDGLVPPMILVGEGALQFASSAGLEIVNAGFHRTEKRLGKYNSRKSAILRGDMQAAIDASDDTEAELDTVGAIAVDIRGNTAVASSSGGIAFKYSGRIGQAATYGAGIWCETSGADRFASCVSGTGEQIIQTFLARELCQVLRQDEVSLASEIGHRFINSRNITGLHPRFMGALILQTSDWLHSPRGFLHVVHTTPGFCWSMASSDHKKAKAHLSRSSSDNGSGSSLTVLGYSV